MEVHKWKQYSLVLAPFFDNVDIFKDRSLSREGCFAHSRHEPCPTVTFKLMENVAWRQRRVDARRGGAAGGGGGGENRRRSNIYRKEHQGRRRINDKGTEKEEARAGDLV